MKKSVLFVGAITMILVGIIFNHTSYVAVGLGLMWMAIAS
jgi:hypothetical protein